MFWGFSKKIKQTGEKKTQKSKAKQILYKEGLGLGVKHSYWDNVKLLYFQQQFADWMRFRCDFSTCDKHHCEHVWTCVNKLMVFRGEK